MNYATRLDRYTEAYNHCLRQFEIEREVVWGHNPYENDHAGRAGWNEALTVVNRRVRDILEYHGTDRRKTL